ncbi:MAG: signal peptidase I [Clostridia bacterium]|nr:signal peptidase I [Clostridia bacterium]
MDKQDSVAELLSIEEIEKERKRIRRNKYYKRAFRRTIAALVVVAAVAVLIATLLLPILQISGDSMSPTLQNNDIVVLIKTKNLERNDLVGFYYQGKILLKRVIALSDETVVIDKDGNVYVNNKLLDEPYVSQLCLGDCDLEFPYKVPAGEYFVMGDKRSNSVDSRSSSIGTVAREEIIGKVFFRAFPIRSLGFIG